MFSYVLSFQCLISVVSLMKVPEEYPWVYKGLLDEVLRHATSDQGLQCLLTGLSIRNIKIHLKLNINSFS